MELKGGYTFEWVENKVVGIGVEKRAGVVAIALSPAPRRQTGHSVSPAEAGFSDHHRPAAFTARVHGNEIWDGFFPGNRSALFFQPLLSMLFKMVLVNLADPDGPTAKNISTP